MANLTISKPTMPTVQGTHQPFNPQQYLPSDPFTASSSVPPLPESSMNAALQKIQEQRNACKVATANQGLIADLYSVQGASMRASFQSAKNTLTRQGYQMDLNFQADKLGVKQNMQSQLLGIERQRADLKVQTAQDKLAHEQRKAAIPKEFYSKIEQLERRKWELRLSDMEAAINSARQLSDSASSSLQTLEAELAA